jgi:hypothetical protein
MTMNGYHPMPDGTVMADAQMPPMNTAPLYSVPSLQDIVEMTNTHERDVQPLRTRMSRDLDLYLGKPHVNRDRATGEVFTKYATYTSTILSTFADKVISWQVLAELLVRVPHLDALGHPEDADNLKERFAIGCIRAADERLKRLGQPSLRGQSSTFGTVKGGWHAGRALLVNRADQTAYVDIQPWDPESVHFGMGPDGLEWACHKVKMTRRQIKAAWGVEMPGGSNQDTSVNADATGIWVYDWYDGMINTVLADNETLKPPTLHGSPRVPVYLSLIGPTPQMQSEGHSNLISAMGESVFAGARDLIEKYNDVMSIMQEIVERARSQTVIAESPDGRTKLGQNPFEDQTQIATRTGDRIYTLELQKMAQETMAFVTTMLGELQRRTLPFSSYGETQFQLSGFAITQLRQATETVLSSRIEALEQVYLQIVNLLYDQFMTGAFEGIKLSGVDSHRQYFNMQVTPQMIADTCDYTVKVVSKLPQDDASQWNNAKMAKELDLFSDLDIHNQVLQTQDAQQALDKRDDQKAQHGLPEAELYTLGQAAARRGDMTLAQMYLQAYDLLMMQKYGLMPPPEGTQQPKGQANAPKASGPPPAVLPAASQGQAPQPETSNNGTAMVAPGTPRPGAQGQSA